MELTKSLVPLAALLGLEANKTTHLEKWVSALGGLMGMLAVLMVSGHYVGPQGAAWVVASMGASAVLLFAVPHGALSQPWAVIGGHLISAVVGVACAKWIPMLVVSAATSVALAIGLMYYFRCIHPPGGATALTAVVGGEHLHALGFQYVLTPVLLNAVTIVLIAVAFNALFSWRRYPAGLATLLAKRTAAETAHAVESSDDDMPLTRAALGMALSALNPAPHDDRSAVQTIYHLAERHARPADPDPLDIRVGQCYSNGHYGPLWQVRRVIRIHDDPERTLRLVTYKVVAGNKRRTTDVSTCGEFMKWARYVVYLNENSWQRISA